jgi:hypothetical protein
VTTSEARLALAQAIYAPVNLRRPTRQNFLFFSSPHRHLSRRIPLASIFVRYFHSRSSYLFDASCAELTLPDVQSGVSEHTPLIQQDPMIPVTLFRFLITVRS